MSNPNDKDVLCTSCRTQFRLAYGEFDEWKRQGRVYSPPSAMHANMPHTVNSCPHCPPRSKPDVAGQLRDVKARLNSMLASGVLSKADAVERAVEAEMCALERDFHPAFADWLATRWDVPAEVAPAESFPDHETAILGDHHDNRTPG